MLLKIGILLLLALLFYSAIFLISAIIPFWGDYKFDLTGEVVIDFIIDLFSSPIVNAKLLIDDRNPLFIVGMIAATIFIFYLAFKFTSKKDYENVSDRYGVQGTSRFALNKEIFKKEQIDGLNERKLNDIILESMNNEKE